MSLVFTGLACRGPDAVFERGSVRGFAPRAVFPFAPDMEDMEAEICGRARGGTMFVEA